MALPPPTARSEREKKLKSILTFAATLPKRFTSSPSSSNSPHDATTLAADLATQIRTLPLPPSSALTAKRNELDRIATELWNLSTRLRREGSVTLQNNGKTGAGNGNEDVGCWARAVCLLRVFAFLLLDAAGGANVKGGLGHGRERGACVRLMRVALKAAVVGIEVGEVEGVVKVLERAADYVEVLGRRDGDEDEEDIKVGERLRMEYYAVRTTLAWRQDRLDVAENMWAKCRLLKCGLTPTTAESMADLLFSMGTSMLQARTYEAAVKWLERAYDVLAEQDIEMLSPEAGELRLSIMQSIAQAHMKLGDAEARSKAWQMMRLLEADYEEKLTVSLLKLELLWTEKDVDAEQVYAVLHRMIRSVLLNEKNFQTIMYHTLKLKEKDNLKACKLFDELLALRLFREEKEPWIEKAVITRVWICCTTQVAEQTLEKLHELFNTVMQNLKGPFSAQATHAAQTLLWMKVDEAYSREQYGATENWCQACLHPLFDKAGEANKSKIARKMILSALARHDYAAAHLAFSKMSETGRNDRTTRYLMYKVGLQNGEADFVAECLDLVCRQSAQDATLLYACAVEAKNSGNKKEAIAALEMVLDKYDHAAPADIHLPTLLRMTAKLLMSELIKDGAVDSEIVERMCTVFDGACRQAKASRRRPSNVAREQFNAAEFEWFSKNTYNLSIKYCAEMQPAFLVRLLNVCIEFIKLLRDEEASKNKIDLLLRLIFCHFLATCALTTLARAEDNIQDCLQYYLQARKHGKELRAITAANIDSFGESAQADLIAKHFQVVKLELEAALKLEQWDEMETLFDECWKFKNPDAYETLADLVLVIHSAIMKASLDPKYQKTILLILQKIINMTSRQSNNDIAKLSRWIRCLYQLALTFDESISLKCVDQAIQIASARQGQSNHYPTTELEWLATTTFNYAVDYYVRENDTKCQEWAHKAMTLAQWGEDGGALRELLMGKFSGLTWGD